MFEREMLIVGLRKQSESLREFIRELEAKSSSEEMDLNYNQEVLKKIEANLRKLRCLNKHLSPYIRWG